jgi:hypothetical protein
VFTIGVVIFVLMMATAFLGYQHSPKWFDISNKESVNFNKKNVMKKPLGEHCRQKRNW